MTEATPAVNAALFPSIQTLDIVWLAVNAEGDRKE